MCPICIFSKQKAKAIPAPPIFRRGAHAPLASVSVDLADMVTPSLTGNRYLVVFTDTYTRYIWVKAIKRKSDALLAAQCFVTDVGMPREFLTDWGTEFSGAFARFCLDNRIRMVKSPPYSPFQNGVVERSNQTLKNAIRSMILECGGSDSWHNA